MAFNTILGRHRVRFVETVMLSVGHKLEMLLTWPHNTGSLSE